MLVKHNLMILGQMGPEQMGPGQMCSGQMGPGQMSTRTNGHQDNWAPGQMGGVQLADKISYKQVWTKDIYIL